MLDNKTEEDSRKQVAQERVAYLMGKSSVRLA